MIQRAHLVLCLAAFGLGCSSSAGSDSNVATSGDGGATTGTPGSTTGGSTTGGDGGSGDTTGGGGAPVGEGGSGGAAGGGGGADAVSFNRCAYIGNSGKNNQAYETWLGEPVPYGEAFLYHGSWSYLDGSSDDAHAFLAGWQSWIDADPSHRLVLGFPPMMTGESGGTPSTLPECAAGDHDDHWKSLARSLVDAHLGKSVLRVGWEFNGDWYPWSAHHHEPEFIGCFRHVVTAMRSVPGAAFEFNWNLSLGGATGYHAEEAYPGDAYVDAIGLDVYDSDWTRYPETGPLSQGVFDASWDARLNGDHGLVFWRQFAADHHKLLTVPEWGVWDRGHGHHGGGDDPTWIVHMHDFLTGPDVEFGCYFDVDAHDGNHQLWPGTSVDHPYVSPFPKSKAAYMDLFGP